MSATKNNRDPGPGGIHFFGQTEQDTALARQGLLAQLANLNLDQHVEATVGLEAGIHCLRFQLRVELARQWAPGHDTTELCHALGLEPQARPADLEREILLAMLLGPVAFHFPSHAELASAVRIRQNIVEAARKTTLAFHTQAAERPEDCWAYHEDCGFTVLPGRPLVTALQKATQPESSGKLYSFSCYRATEYVILLGIAQELQGCNPGLARRLQRQWETRAIMSGRFHDVFLREYGSMSEPLPPRYYVPGDRLWFRNPDAHSSDVAGYEGSWVFYLGAGLFSNFWKRDQPYTLTAKCVELFHWRHATYRDAAGELQIDESVVEERVQASLQDPAEVEHILASMLRYREPKGVYADGGCIDSSREYPRWVHPDTADLVLPCA
ncbi:MAG: hypothetical protein ACRECD_01695 [Burkholderiaceae bacterium]